MILSSEFNEQKKILIICTCKSLTCICMRISIEADSKVIAILNLGFNSKRLLHRNLVEFNMRLELTTNVLRVRPIGNAYECLETEDIE